MSKFRTNTAFDEEMRKFDKYAHAVTIITENHRLIHDGMFFTAFHRNAAVAAAGTLDVLFSVPANTYPHFQLLEITLDGGTVTYDMYEDTVTSADGTALVGYNRNRNSIIVPDMTLFHTPTVTDAGTILDSLNFPSAGNKVAIFDETTHGEWVLKPSTKYLLRFTNGSVGDRDISVRMAGYELSYDQ
jgi:hypothetical protein